MRRAPQDAYPQSDRYKSKRDPIPPFIDNLPLMQAPARDVTTDLSMYSTGRSLHARMCRTPLRGSRCPARTLIVRGD
jgi:hypothetical protein